MVAGGLSIAGTVPRSAPPLPPGSGALHVVRPTSADLHNFILNEPAVRATFGHGGERIDLSALLAQPNEYVLLTAGDAAAAVFEWSAPAVWQAHFGFLPSYRGAVAIDALQRMADWMHVHLGARTIWGQIPLRNRAARWVARQIGAVSAGRTSRGPDGEVEMFRMDFA